MAEIVVREAIGEEDVEAVRMLLERYGEYLTANPHGAHICIGSYAEELAGLPKPYAALLLALIDKKAAGCVALKPISQSAVKERACEMKRLWVDAEFRGLALGRRLVEEAIAWAKRTGHEAIYLDTVPAAFPEASRIYRDMGFVQVERYNDNPVADVMFFRLGL
jgi:GNAT superfamily N-acetyltransferase